MNKILLIFMVRSGKSLDNFFYSSTIVLSVTLAQSAACDSPHSGVQCRRSRQWLLLHGQAVDPAHRAVLGHQVAVLAVPVERAVVGRGLRRGVDVPRPLVDRRAAHGRSTAAGSPVNGRQRHVGVLVLHLEDGR